LQKELKIGKQHGWRESPFCASVSAGLVAVWDQHFLHNSTFNSPFYSSKLWGFDAALVPFSLLVNLAMSLSVVV
jgi:hypothetical protein